MNGRAGRAAIWLVIVPALLNALTGPWLAFTGEDATAFEESTGEDYATFQAQYPGVLQAMDTQERLVGVLLTGFSLFGVLAALAHRRRADAHTRFGLALVPFGFAAVAIVLLAGDVTGLGGYYAAVALVTGAGAALAAMGGGAAAPAAAP